MSALEKAKGAFDSSMCLSASAVTELQWWVHNLSTAFSLIQLPAIDHAICSDASIPGWEGVMNNICTGGHWQPNEATHHIKNLELLAAYFVLKSFLKYVLGKHIKMIIDNTTAVSVINNMGTCHSDPCNSLPKCGHCVRKMAFGSQQPI